MKLWFLNVGHGDCTVIEHASGRLSMIDINNLQDYDPQSRQELLAELATKIALAVDHEVGTLTGGGHCLAALKADARRLAPPPPG